MGEGSASRVCTPSQDVPNAWLVGSVSRRACVQLAGCGWVSFRCESGWLNVEVDEDNKVVRQLPDSRLQIVNIVDGKIYNKELCHASKAVSL